MRIKWHCLLCHNSLSKDSSFTGTAAVVVMEEDVCDYSTKSLSLIQVLKDRQPHVLGVFVVVVCHVRSLNG